MAKYSDSGRVNRAGGPGQLLLTVIKMFLFYVVVFITLFPDWAHSAWQVEENLMGRVKRFDGVFLRCISPKQGAFKCDNYGKPTIVQRCKYKNSSRI